MEILNETAKNIIVYLLLVTIASNLIGSSSYKKYMGIFTGMLLIIIVAKPVFALFHMEEKLSYHTLANQLQVSAGSIDQQVFQAEDFQKEQMHKAYERELLYQIQTIGGDYGISVKKLEVRLEEREEEYGGLESLAIYLNGTKEEAEEAIGLVAIEPVRIKGTKEQIEKETGENLKKDQFKKKIAEVTHLQEEKITLVAE